MYGSMVFITSETVIRKRCTTVTGVQSKSISKSYLSSMARLGVRNHLEQKRQIDPQSGIKKRSSTRKSVLEQQKSAAAANTFTQGASNSLDSVLPYCFLSIRKSVFPRTTLLFEPGTPQPPPKCSENYSKLGYGRLLSKKQRFREDLQRSRSRISISFDLWTSSNPYAILGVVAMWIDTVGK